MQVTLQIASTAGTGRNVKELPHRHVDPLSIPAYWYEAQNDVHVAHVSVLGAENTGPFKRYCAVPRRPVRSVGLMLRK